MIQAQPVPSPAQRIAVLCPGFAADRVRRQPWHVADGLARGLAALGHDVRLFTDAGRAATSPHPTRSRPWSCSSGGQPGARAAAPPSPPSPSTGCSSLTGAAQLARLRPTRRSAHRSRW